MCLLLRRRSQSSPLSCHSWIPSIYNPSAQPSSSHSVEAVALQPPWGPMPSWPPGEQNRGYPVPQMRFCPSTILCSQPLGPGSALPLSLHCQGLTAGAEVAGDAQPTWSTHSRPAHLPALLFSVPGSASLLPIPSVTGSQDLGLVSLTLCLLWSQ